MKVWITGLTYKDPIPSRRRVIRSRITWSRPRSELPGFRVVRNLGVVRGITVRSRSVFGTIGGTLQALVGGNITLFTQLCEKARGEDFES